MVSFVDVKLFLKHYWKSLVFIVTPILLIPLPCTVTGQEGRAGYLLLLMGVFWCTEVVPLGITALMPIVFVPLFGISTTKHVCNAYMESISLMLLGGMFIAIAVEKCNLHRRIAIKVLLMIGTSPRWLMLGFMVPTWFLSMWINNTATTAMMMPIVQEVLTKLRAINEQVSADLRVESGNVDKVDSSLKKSLHSDVGLRKGDSHAELVQAGSNLSISSNNGDHPKVPRVVIGQADDGDIEANETSFVNEAYYGNIDNITTGSRLDVQTKSLTTGDISRDASFKSEISTVESTQGLNKSQLKSEKSEEQKKFEFLEKALILSVAFAANAGGTGTLIGTTPNLVLKGQADTMWREYAGKEESPVNFATFMVLGFPISLLNLLVIWIWLELHFIGPKEFFKTKTTYIDKQYQKAIRAVVKVEYESLGNFKQAEIQILVIFIILVLLWFTRQPDFIPGWADLFEQGYTSDAIAVMAVCVLLFAVPTSYPTSNFAGKADYLLTWKWIKEKLAWDVVLLVGGGFALADAVMESGLSTWVGYLLSHLDVLPGPVLILVFGFIVTLITQVTSNVASCTLMLPIGAAMAESMCKNPLYMMFPITVSVQYAFMLPVATPPNAVAFSTGKIKVMDMVKAGVVLNLLCCLVMTLAVETWVSSFFGLEELPWPVEGCGGLTTTNTTDFTTSYTQQTISLS